MDNLTSSIILDFDSIDDFNEYLIKTTSVMKDWNSKYDNYSYEILKDIEKLVIQVNIYVLSSKGNTPISERDSIKRELTSHLSIGDYKLSI